MRFVPAGGPYTISIVLDKIGCPLYDTLASNSSAPAPPVSFSLGADTLLCLGNSLLLSADPSLSPISWSTGSSSPSLVVSQPGAYYYHGFDANGCVRYSDTIQVSFAPPLAAGLPDTVWACAPPLYLQANAGFLSYQWQGGGTTAYDTMTSFGTNWVTLTHPGGCMTIDTIEFLQLPIATSAFTHSVSGMQSSFFSTSAVFDSLHWEFGDGSSSGLANPVHSYSTSGLYTVCLETYTSCGADTTCQSITYTSPTPIAQISFFQSGGSNPLLFQFYGSGSQYPATYYWTFGDGSSSSQVNPSHIFPGPGTYTVCLIVTNTYGADTTCQTITVTCNTPYAAFTITQNQLTAQFIPVLGNNASSWQWDFGDGNTSTASAPIHTYGASGTYTVRLIASNLCGSDTSCQNIVVTQTPPVSNFSYQGYFNNPLVQFTNLSQFANSYWWDFGDGSTATVPNPSHSYLSPGYYQVRLAATAGVLSDTSVQTLGVPLADFSFSGSWPTFSFTNNSLYGTQAKWDFGDGTSSTQLNPTHTYSSGGTMQVQLIMFNGFFSDTLTQSINVVALDQAALSGLSIYPNPSTGRVYIDAAQESRLSWQLFDAQGRLVAQRAEARYAGGDLLVDLSAFSAGIYHLRLQGEAGVRTFNLCRE